MDICSECLQQRVKSVIVSASIMKYVSTTTYRSSLEGIIEIHTSLTELILQFDFAEIVLQFDFAGR